MRGTWGAVERPRTLGLLAVVVPLLGVVAAPTGVGVHQPSAGAPAAAAAGSASGSDPASALPRPVVGVPSVLPASPAATAPPAVPAPPGRPATTGGPGTTGGPATPTPSDVSSVAGGRVVYLTFDDGPDPSWTPQVLALLARYHARATFFQVGSQVREHPSTARLVRAAGQAVGNHSAQHRDLTDLTAAQLRAEIGSGVASARCLRPPFGAVDPRVRRAAAQAGQRVVIWSVDTEDWSRPGVPVVVRRLLQGVRPGRIVLMHDGGGDRRQTLAALRQALPRLVAAGYRFEAVPGC